MCLAMFLVLFLVLFLGMLLVCFGYVFEYVLVRFRYVLGTFLAMCLICVFEKLFWYAFW